MFFVLSFEFQCRIDMVLMKDVYQLGTFIFGFFIFLQTLTRAHLHIHDLLVQRGELCGRSVLYGRNGFGRFLFCLLVLSHAIM